jgi:hypothetical protein
LYLARDPVGDLTFRFRSDLSDITDFVSRSHCPVPVARLSCRPKREEEEQEGEGEEEMRLRLEREIFFLRERDLVLSFK